MEALDNRVREELAATGELFDGYHPRMAEVHRQNAEKLSHMIERFGWPGNSLVGEEGATAAWLVLQHAIGNPDLQRRCLPLLEKAVESNDIPAYQFACLADRICVFEGRPQRYGTQFDWDDSGLMSPHPLLDAGRVDEYRQSVGLGPLAEKIEEMRARTAAEGRTFPENFRQRQKDRADWERSVGWRE